MHPYMHIYMPICRTQDLTSIYISLEYNLGKCEQIL